MQKLSSCGSIHSCKGKTRTKSYSWVPAIVIAILPKCPFCIMAYSGAVSLCSGKMIFPNADVYSSYIITALALLVLFGIYFNNKGKRTAIAMLIASMGIVLLAISQFILFSEVLYYLSVALLFFGIWYNASFSFFYRRYFQNIFKTSTHINSKT